MPDFVPAPGVVSLDAIWVMDQQSMENTFHYHIGVAATSAILQGICNTYITWASANSALWTTAATFVKCYARDLTTQTGLVEEVVPPGPGIHGTDAASPLPNNVSFALTRRSGHAGRANRGRVFAFGITSAQMNGENSLAASRAGTYRSLYDGLMAAQLSDNNATEVILHRKLGTFIEVEQYGFSDLFVDSQRRRLPGHNRHR